MDLKQIQELIKAVNKSDLSELSIKDGEFEITIKQTPANEHQQQVITVQAPTPVAQQVAAMPATPAAEAPAAAAPQPAAPAASNTVIIKSPMIGTFYRSPKPGEPPFINVGDTITEGQHICIIEAMKLFNEIESEISGKIVKVLIDDASPVEYDQPLFEVEPA